METNYLPLPLDTLRRRLSSHPRGTWKGLKIYLYARLNIISKRRGYVLEIFFYRVECKKYVF